jgi:hypothetical protein
MFSQNSGNAISETQILKIFPREYPPEPPRNLAPLVLSWWFRHWLVPPQKNFAGSTTGGQQNIVQSCHRL